MADLGVELYPLCNTELWTLGLDEARSEGWAAEHVFAEGAAWGMAWVFAIQGMFEAIKRTYMCWDCNCYVGLGKWQEGLAAICVCDCWRNDDHVCAPVLRVSEDGGSKR